MTTQLLPRQRAIGCAFITCSLLLLTAPSCSISFQTSKQQDGGVFRSSDGGVTWAQIVNAGTTKKGKPIRIDNVDVLYMQFDPTNSATMYLGTRGVGIYRSTDNGNSWMNTQLVSGTYPAFAIDPLSPSILYAASGGTILKSSNAGAGWSAIYVESRPDRSITNLVVQPSNPNVILAGTNTGEFLLSRDYGNSWQLYTTLGASEGIISMFFAEDSSTTLFVLGSKNNLYKSTDVGRSWTSIGQSLSKYPGATTISWITTLQHKPDIFYVATPYGLLTSKDSGTTWEAIQTLVPFGSQPIQLVAVNPDNQNILYVMVGNRLRKSEDGGKTWDAKIVLPTSRIITTLYLNPENPNELFMGTMKPRKK
jgi:photosystem II stability/assembly factor-like uncharacterized protein